MNFSLHFNKACWTHYQRCRCYQSNCSVNYPFHITMHSSYRDQFCNKLSLYTTETGVLYILLVDCMAQYIVYLNCTHIIAHTQFTLHTYIINMMWFVARKPQKSCSAQYAYVSYYILMHIIFTPFNVCMCGMISTMSSFMYRLWIGVFHTLK